MRFLALALAAGLLACAPPDAPQNAPPPQPAPGPAVVPAALAPADTLDVQAWLADVRALDAEADGLDYDSLVARSLRLAGRLDPAVGWRRACDTYHDPSTGEAIYDPMDPTQEPLIGRGLMNVTPLGPHEAAVSILCARGAYQGSWALVHVEGARATLVRAPELGEGYRPAPFEAATFGEPLFESDGRAFTTFVKSRGMGDCGAFTRYRLGDGGRADILEIRARACDDEPPEDLWPETWPVVYPAD